jgi:hypothetical protein
MTDEDKALLVTAQLDGRLKPFTDRLWLVYSKLNHYDMEEWWAVPKTEVVRVLRSGVVVGWAR